MEKQKLPQGEIQKKVFIASNFVLKGLFFALLFLTPLFFIPKSLDFFDFNKIVLLYFIASVSLILWAAKMVSAKTFFIRRSSLDLPLLLVLLSSVVATFFSSNKYYSVFGTQGSFEYSLISQMVLYLYFYTVSSNLDKEDILRGLKFVVFGAAATSAIFLPSVFGIDILKQPWSGQFFFTLGSISSGLLYLGVASILGLFLTISGKTPTEKSIFSVLTTLSVLPLVIALQIIPIIVFIIGSLFVLLYAKPQNVKQGLPFLGSILTTSIIFLCVVLTPQLRSSMGLKYPLPINVYPSIKTSWAVASAVIGERPFFGAGLNNFGASYSLFKPVYVNLEETWNTRFNRSGSELINIITTSGIVGLLCWIFLMARIFKISFLSRKKAVSIVEDSEEDGYDIAIKAALVAILLTLILRPQSTTLAILLFALLAGLSVFDSSSVEIKKESMDAPVTILGIALVASGVLWYFAGRAYLADYYFRLSLEDLAQGGRNTYNLQRLAVSYNPISDLYRSNYAQSNLALANALSQKKDLTDADKSDIQQLVSQAIRETRVVTETLSPLSADAWEVRGFIYKSLDQAATDATSWAISAYNNAISLDPNNPRLRVDLGGIYFTNKDYQNAAAIFAGATRLKNDYANAHYNLAQSYKELKAFAEAKTELEIVLRLIPEGSEDAKVVTEDLTAVSKIVAEAQAQAAKNTKPSVEQIEAKGIAPTPNQQPLTNPADQNPPAPVE